MSRGYDKDYYGGGLMLLLGIGTIWKASHYTLGTLSHMGPGYFPVAVGAILAASGLLIALGARGRRAPRASQTAVPAEWRGWSCIVLGNLAFVVLGRYGGLLPASFAVVFLSALGDRQNTLKDSLLLSAAMTVVAALVFWWALRLQLPLLRWG